MRFKFFLLFFLLRSIANAQDTIPFAELYSKEGNHKLTGDQFIGDGFYNPNQYLINQIYHDEKLFTGYGKLENIDCGDEHGTYSTFIATITNGIIQKVFGINEAGVYFFRFYRCPNDSILARDTTFRLIPDFHDGGYSVVMEFSFVVFSMGGERYFTETSYEYPYSEIVQTTGKYLHIKSKDKSYGEYEWTSDPGWYSRATDTLSKTITIDTIVNDTEMHYEYLRNQKTMEMSYYPYNGASSKKEHAYFYDETKKDTLQLGWYEDGRLKYAELKNGIIREWYENGIMKSEQIKNENGEFEIKRWDENGKFIWSK
jgi:hypothetical protein